VTPVAFSIDRYRYRFAAIAIALELARIIGRIYMRLSLEPPALVGASERAATHFWFPSGAGVALNSSHVVLDVRLADDCGDYYCNKSNTHKPSDPSHQVLLSTDGGRSFAPWYDVGGFSPWDPTTHGRPFMGPCVIQPNDTSWLVLYQGRILPPLWQSPVARLSVDGGALRPGLTSAQASYRAAGQLCNGRMWTQAVERARAPTVGWVLSAQCDTADRSGAAALIFGSTDGFDWDLKASIAVASHTAPCTSPGENTIVRLATGALLLVARCGAGQPLLGWVSDDDGTSWQSHMLPTAMQGVMPTAVRMANGAIVLATGRGGLAVWLNPAGDGREWAFTNIGEEHNRLVDSAALRFTPAIVAMNITHETTAYNTLLRLGPETGVVCYDRLSWSNKSSWNGPPGDRGGEDHVFCMRFQVSD
jgi:hypothetical protein